MKKNSEEKYQRHVREVSGDYTVKKSRLWDNVAKVVTFLLAVVIWLYVVATNDVTVEETFDLVPVDVQGSQYMADKGLAVQTMSFDRLNITLKGTRNALSKVNEETLSAYVDVSNIDKAGDYTLTVKYKMPSGVALAQPAESVQLTVDSLTSRIFKVDHTQIMAESWSVADSCYIDYENASADVDYVVVEAPTRVLAQIENIRFTANATITLTSSGEVSATLEAVDANGTVINDDSVTLRAYKGGVITEAGSLSGGMLCNQVSVRIPLVKQKTVPVTVSEQDGLLSSAMITMNPSTVVIKGAPDAVDAISALDLGSFSANHLKDDVNGHTEVSFTLSEKPSGVYEILMPDGTPFEKDEVKVTARIDVGDSYILTVPADCITVAGGNALLDEESISIKLRTTGDATYFLLLENRISEGKGGISLMVDVTDLNLKTAQEAPVKVIFSADFEGKVYEVYDEDAPYTATVKPLE